MEKRKKITVRPFQDRGILIALFVVLGLAAIFNPNFRSINTYASILRQGSILAISAIGMTFVIITGTFDLSVGSTLALVGMATILVVERLGVPAAIFTAIGVGVIAGAINGFLVSSVRIPAFIATLAMMFIFRSMAYFLTDGAFVQTNLQSFVFWGNGSFLGLPISFYVMVGLGVLGKLILVNTRFGRHVCAVGNSEKASWISGISKPKIVFFAFVLVGLFNSIAAFLMSSLLWSANPWMKETYGFDVIAAVVIGGTSMKGGKGSIFNSCIGAIFLAATNTVMNMFQVSSYLQRVVIGVILIVAVTINGIKQIIDQKIVTRIVRREHKARLEEE